MVAGKEDKMQQGRIMLVHPESMDRTFAASSATAAEERVAKLGRLPDGTKPVVPKKSFGWRPQVKNIFEEPEVEIKEMENLDWLFKDQGKAALRTKSKLPTREDIIEFDIKEHREELEENLQWRECPNQFQTLILALIVDQWDAFNKGNMRKHIRGYEFSIDIGTNAPVCCKQPRYGPHESKVILELVGKLESLGLVEPDEGPYGALAVLAAKPNQGHKHWSEYIFRLCVSYRKLNAVTRPFHFYVARCDDAVEMIGESKFFITLDLDAGYWQVKLHEASKDKTAFYIPDGKRHWNVMPMGILNAHAYFVCMTMDMKKEWDMLFRADKAKAIHKLKEVAKRSKSILQALSPEGIDLTTQMEKLLDQGIEEACAKSNPGSAVIVDDLMLHDSNEISLIAYFLSVLEILVHYRVTINLRKGRFLSTRAEFVGIDVLAEGNSPASSKYDAINRLTQPKRFTDIRAIIGLLGFYAKWMPNYENEIRIWREVMKTDGELLSPEEEEKVVATKWDDKCEELLDQLKKDIIKGPVLKRPNPKRRFYLKTDWSKEGMGGVLLQADTTEEAEEAMRREMKGGKCEFDKLIKGLRLRPVAFISRACKGNERDYHSYRGEAATGLFAMRKFRPYLIGREFTWITDCSGLVKFFEGDDDFTHTTQRWRLELLAFNFTIVHRPGRMLFECDLLSRYESRVSAWRARDVTGDRRRKVAREQNVCKVPGSSPKQQTHNGVFTHYLDGTAVQDSQVNLPRTYLSPKVIGPETGERSDLAMLCDKARVVWMLGSGLQTASLAFEELGSKALITLQTDEDEYWKEREDCADIIEASKRLEKNSPEVAEWVIAPRMQDFKSQAQREAFELVIAKAFEKGANTVMLCWPEETTNESLDESPYWESLHWEARVQQIASAYSNRLTKTVLTTVKGSETGADVDSHHRILIASSNGAIDHWKGTRSTSWLERGELANVLDEPNENYSDYVHMNNSEANKKSIEVPTVDPTKTYTRQVFMSHQLAPNLHKGAESVARGEFVVETTDGWVPGRARVIRPWEALQLLGFQKSEAKNITQLPSQEWDEQRARIRDAMPSQSWKEVIAPLLTHELETSQGSNSTSETAEMLQYGWSTPEHAMAMTNRSINSNTTLPLPTREKWILENQRDPDIAKVMKAIREKSPLVAKELKNLGYYHAWKKGRLDIEDDLLVEYEEPKTRHIRQLRRIVVPEAMRPTIIAAYHATPLAGHVGCHKTYYRVATRYWWPGMTDQVRSAVKDCGHCRAANMTSHKGQKILQAISYDAPFDVVTMDVWVPGKTDPTSRNGTPAQRQLAKQIQNTASLTYVDVMTGHATSAYLKEVSSAAVSITAFTACFIVRGMPKLVLIDAGSEFKDLLIKMLKYLGIQYYVVSPENHDGILCERFHRYLNKVQKIGAADMETFEEWAMNVAFATYGWNAAPIDGTDIQRAFAATARTFQFPADHITDDLEVLRSPGAEQALEHVETAFPLWTRQTEMLKVLNDERRKHHRELKNKNRKRRRFVPGDLVIVRKQVQSRADKGAPSKLQLRARGPYRVIRQAEDSEDSYILQKVAGDQRLLRNYQPKEIKEASIRIEKLPSRLVLHKRVDTPDTRLAQAHQILSRNPLEKTLGLPDFGTYKQAAPDSEYAFVKVQDMWQEKLDESEETTEEIEELEIQQAIEEAAREDATRKIEHDSKNLEARSSKRQRREVHTKQTLPRTMRLKMLYDAIQKSKDKLFIIAQSEEGNMEKTWWIVQVDPEDEDTNGNTARRNGKYHCKWYYKCPSQADKLITRECSFWPLIKQLDAAEYYRATIPIAPAKIERTMRKRNDLRWYQKPIELFDLAISGPFDFEPGYKIPDSNFEELQREADKRNVDASDVDAVSPLPGQRRKKGKKQRK